MNKEKIILNIGDVAIKVSAKGETELYIPNQEDISSEAVMQMLKEIRKLELTFTEIYNEIFKENEK